MNLAFGSLSAVQLFGHGVKLWLSRLPVLFLLNLILLLPTFVALIFVLLASSMGTTLLMISLLVLIWLVFMAISLAATVYVVVQALVDRGVTMTAALQFGVSRLGSLLTAGVLMAVVVSAPLLVGALLSMVLLPDGGFLFILLLILGLVITVPAAVYLLAWFLFTAQATMVEGSGAGPALSRSKALTDGVRQPTLIVAGLLAVVYLIPLLAAWILSLILPYQESYFNLLIDVLLVYLLSVLLSGLIAVIWTLCYFDCRARKEPLDLPALAQQQQQMV